MGEPLKRMLSAMLSELHRQAREKSRGPYIDAGEDDPDGPDFSDMIIDGHVDLEKVARAGLEAIREPDDDLIDVIYAGDISTTPEDAWRLALGKLLGEQQ